MSDAERDAALAALRDDPQVRSALAAAAVADVVDDETREALAAVVRCVLPRCDRSAMPAAWATAIEALDAFARVPPAPSRPGVLSRLATRLDLSDDELLVVVAAISSDIDVRFARLWSLAADRLDVLRPRLVTLAAALGDGGLAPSVLALLDANHPLRALGLVQIAPGRDAAAGEHLVAPTAALWTYLGGLVETDAGATLVRGSVPLAEALPAKQEAEPLVVALRRACERPPSRARDATSPVTALVLDGTEGSGRGVLAGALAASLGYGAVHARIDDPARADARVRGLVRLALLHRAVPCLEVPPEHAALVPSLLAPVAAAYRGPFFLLADGNRALPEPWRTLVVPTLRPDAHERERLWTRALGALAVTVDREVLADVARRFPLGRGAVFRAAASTAARALLDGGVVMPAAIAGAARDVLDARTPLAERIRTVRRLDDLIAAPDTLALIEEIIDFGRYRREVVDEWGFGRDRGFHAGLKVLFSGPPGTGKTMSAEIIAAELDLDLFRIDLSNVVSKWIGETEKNLKQVFDQAEASGGILLFDEADALFGKRTADVKSSTDRYANMEVNYLLQRMEGFDGICLLTTNFESALDEAFRRRLNFRVRFSAPDVGERALLWQKMIPADVPLEERLDFREVAKRFDMSGGNIRNAALRAAFLAAREGTGLATRHLLVAAEREFAEIGRIASTGSQVR